MQRFIAEVERTGKLPALAKDTSDALRHADSGPGWSVSVSAQEFLSEDDPAFVADEFRAALLVSVIAPLDVLVTNDAAATARLTAGAKPMIGMCSYRHLPVYGFFRYPKRKR